MPTDVISVDDPRDADVREMLRSHLAFTTSVSPPEDMHALSPDGLLQPDVTLFGFRRDGQLLAIGALKQVDSRRAELKSMHTAWPARGQGIGRAMLEHLIATARDRGYRQLSLETGTAAAFAPARSLYANAGFAPCRPFGSYAPSRNSTFMTLPLGERRSQAGFASGSGSGA